LENGAAWRLATRRSASTSPRNRSLTSWSRSRSARSRSFSTRNRSPSASSRCCSSRSAAFSSSSQATRQPNPSRPADPRPDRGPLACLVMRPEGCSHCIRRQGPAISIRRILPHCPMTSGRVSVGSFGFSIGTSQGFATSTGRLAVSQSTARRAPRVAILRGFRGGRRPSRRVLRPAGHPSEWRACKAPSEACYLRLQHAGSGAARRVIAAVMTWPKGPSQWIAGSARPLGRMLLDLDIVPAQLVGSYVGAAPHPGGCRAKPG
jgi:hypothetical protein